MNITEVLPLLFGFCVLILGFALLAMVRTHFDNIRLTHKSRALEYQNERLRAELRRAESIPTLSLRDALTSGSKETKA